MTRPLPFQFDDGGRFAAGYRGRTGDCVTRALAPPRVKTMPASMPSSSLPPGGRRATACPVRSISLGLRHEAGCGCRPCRSDKAAQCISGEGNCQQAGWSVDCLSTFARSSTGPSTTPPTRAEAGGAASMAIFDCRTSLAFAWRRPPTPAWKRGRGSGSPSRRSPFPHRVGAASSP